MGVGAVIAGGIGAISSYKSAKSQSKAAESATASADAAARLQYETSMEQLDFQKEMYSNWESIYGPIQQNLSNFYKNRSSDSLASQGIQAIEQQFAQSRHNLDTALAKRGITNSGATAASLAQLETGRMLGKASVMANAPQQAALEQLNFLSGGANQQSNSISGIANAYSNQMNVLSNQASNQYNLANNYSSQANQAYAGIGNSIGSGINMYMMSQAMNPYGNMYTQTGGVNYGAGYQGPNNLGVR